jgi:hypothetical protein
VETKSKSRKHKDGSQGDGKEKRKGKAEGSKKLSDSESMFDKEDEMRINTLNRNENNNAIIYEERQARGIKRAGERAEVEASS